MENKFLAQGHSENWWQNWDSNPDRSHFLPEHVGWAIPIYLWAYLENTVYHRANDYIVQKSANFHSKGQIVIILDFTSHVVSVVITQPCCATVLHKGNHRQHLSE